MLELKFPVIISTAPLYVVHNNSVNSLHFFSSLKLLTHSLHGLNTPPFRVSYSVIFFLSLIFITHYSLCGRLPSFLHSIQTLV